MRERKYIKFRVDMYEDTKFKIIDMKPERDVIHYIWSRIVTLAGKVNCEGELYMSKNIPYTIETLAIEFNRNVEQVKLALDVFRELEMIEIHEGNVYIVKNFAKHQNIKVKEKIKSKVEEEETSNEEVNIIETCHEQVGIDQDEDYKDIDKEEKKNEKQNQRESDGNRKNRDELNLHKNNITNVDKNRINNKDSTNSQEKIPISLEKKRKKPSKNKKKEVNIEVAEEEFEDDRFVCFYESGEERPLEEGESVISAWAF